MATQPVTPQKSKTSKLWLWLGAILATAEETVPIFIHNPQSQKIEGVVVTAGNALFETLANISAQQSSSDPQAPSS